jgi:hypothetical protein
MSDVKDFATNNLTPTLPSPELTRTPELKESFVEFDGDLRVKFGFTFISPMSKFKKWISKVFA